MISIRSIRFGQLCCWPRVASMLFVIVLATRNCAAILETKAEDAWTRSKWSIVFRVFHDCRLEQKPKVIKVDYSRDLSCRTPYSCQAHIRIASLCWSPNGERRSYYSVAPYPNSYQRPTSISGQNPAYHTSNDDWTSTTPWGCFIPNTDHNNHPFGDSLSSYDAPEHSGPGGMLR